MVCAVSMAALHGLLLLAGSGAGGHVHAGAPASNVAATTGAGGRLLAVIALEMTTALLAATLAARLRSVPTPSR
jgi:hypothetical protein